MARETILAVDDDKALLRLLQIQLESGGYRVLPAKDGESALDLFSAGEPDLVILDVGLPRVDGISICRQLRNGSNVPILILSSFREDDHKVTGLEQGADDYLGKPYNPKELLARVRALLRRSSLQSQPSKEEPVLRVNEIVLDTRTHEVTKDERPLSLTPIEFSILKILMKTPEEVRSRETIVKMIWGPHFLGNTRTVDTHIGNLRKKLIDSSVSIDAVRGVGFKLLTKPR